MDLQAAFRARLLANATINLLTGGRVSWGGRPQGASLPAIVLTKAAPGRDWTFAAPDPLEQPWVQIDVWGSTVPSAAGVISAVQAEMERLDTVTVGGWKFQPPGVLVNDQWPGPEDLPGGTTAFRIMHDYRFWACPA